MSSYQLATTSSLKCDIAVILNISEDHLQWHKTFEAYTSAKLTIIRDDIFQNLIIPKSMIKKIDKLKFEKSKIIPIEDCVLSYRGMGLNEHNKISFSVIERVSELCNVEKDRLAVMLKTFKIPPYRCQKIYEDDKRIIINDSKSTNMDSTLHALKGLKVTDVLILSGQAKGMFSNEWANYIYKNCKYVYADGDLSKNQHLFPKQLRKKITFCETLKEAVIEAINICKVGTILFSPGAASFDEFLNYEERGEAFNEYINENI